MQKIVLFKLTLVLLSAAAMSIANPLPNKPHIYVEGSAEIEAVPDQMSITVGLEATNPELSVAKESVDERSRRLIEACKALGIAPKDLKTTALHVSPAYHYRGGEQVPLGTRVYRQADITLRDLSQYTAFMAALVDAEISNIVNTQLEVSDEKALADKALAKAVDDARQRAEGVAKSLGKRLGAAHSVSEFDLRSDERHQLFAVQGRARGFNTEAEMALRQDSGEPFEPGLIVTKAKVYVVFLIK